MNVSARSYLTAGVAALGAGAIALTPIQPIPTHVAPTQQKAVANLAVELASTIDPITPWVDTLTTAFGNITALVGYYLEKPFPLAQTTAANTVTYFQELTNGNADLIPGQIWNNVQTFFQAPWDPGTQANPPGSDPAFYEGDYISNVPITNKVPFLGVLSQRQLYQSLPLALSTDPDLLTTLAPLLAFSANHYSGQVAGLVGPLLAPVIELTRSFTAVSQYFQDGDVIGAINELINIPANVTNGVLNGAGYLDLTGVVNAIQPLPDSIKSIGLNLGGLISPPVPFEGTLDAPTALSGGTLFDNIATEAAVGGLSVKTPGLPVSWFGSVIGLGHFLSEELLVTPPPVPTQAVAPAAAAAVAAPVVAEAPAPAAAVADDPAPAPVVAEVAEVADAPEAPAPRAVSAAAPQQRAAAADNTGSGRTSHTGARGKHRNG